MKELSLNILDIAKNSVKAESENIEINIDETESTLKISIKDDGKGMSEDFLKSVTDPFCTTRTTRSVGMGIPLFKLSAEQTGGSFEISSRSIEEFPNSHGTITSATFFKTSIDFTPLGDVIGSVVTLIGGSPKTHFVFCHKLPNGEVRLDTAELVEILGDVPLDYPEVLMWIKEYLEDLYNQINL